MQDGDSTDGLIVLRNHPRGPGKLAPEAPTLKLPRVISSDDWNAVNRLSVVMVSICNTALALFAPWCSCTRTTFADLSTFGGWQPTELSAPATD